MTSLMPQDVCFSPPGFFMACPCPHPKASDVTVEQAEAMGSGVVILIYGLGRLRFANSDIVTDLRAENGPALTAQMMLNVVKEDIFTRQRISAIIFETTAMTPSKAYLGEVAARTKFLPASAYMKDEFGQQYELNAYNSAEL